MDDVIVLASGRKLHPAVIERDVEQIDGIDHALLHYQEKLQLWLNLENEIQLESVKHEVSQVLAKQPTPIRCEFKVFHPRLSIESGELTAKGTIRRGHVIQQRLID
jgi:hypothetical protein